MLVRSVLFLAAALLVLPFVAFGASRAEAGPPDHYADLVVGDVELTPGCVAQASWSGLNGGKPLFVEVRLTYKAVDDRYYSVLAPGADVIYKVKQNADYLEVDLSGPAASDLFADHGIAVSFMDRKGNQLRATEFAFANCG